MGGVVRTIRRAVGSTLRTITGAPSKKQIAAQQAAAQQEAARKQAEAAAKAKAEAEAKAKQEAALKAQQQVEVVDATNPDDVVYSGEGGEMGSKKKKKKKGGTILTGSKGVIGDAPTEKATLLGG
jgi:membrane protein involved in colicin uptake